MKLSKKFGFSDIFIGLVILLGVIVVANIILTSSLSSELKKNAESYKESLKPAKIEVTLLRDSRCSDCSDISAVLSHIRSSNVNITKQAALEFGSAQGKALIAKYKIGKIPSVIVTGDIGRLTIQGLEKKEDALLPMQLNPPYTDAVTGEVIGRVAVYYLIDSKCGKCSDLMPLISQIKAAGIRISEQKNITIDSDEGKSLAKKYSIGLVPGIIMSKDAAAYDIMQKAWQQVGSREQDGSYVLRLVSPPFINLTTGQLRGLVSITYITDKSCTECYDVTLHRQILTNSQTFAMRLEKEDTADVSDARGKALVAKYNITSVPTAILSSEAGVYPSSQVLRRFFSVEDDGSYVFRKLQVLGTYKDLGTNSIVKQSSPPQ